MLRWCCWLFEMEKKDEEKRMVVGHQKLVSHMTIGAEGGASLLHKITNPLVWSTISGGGRGRCQTFGQV